MRVLSMVSSKGGSGKSTLAACLAVAAAQDGLRVAIIDADPQGSLIAWSRRRATETAAIPIPVQAVEVTRLADTIRSVRQSGGADLAIVDTAGIADAGSIIAARGSDLTIVPVKPTQLDIDGAGATTRRLSHWSVSFVIVLTQVPTSARDRARDAAREIVKLGRTSRHYSTSRVAYVDAIGLGLGVAEHDPRSTASDEVRAIWTWIKSEMDGHAAP